MTGPYLSWNWSSIAEMTDFCVVLVSTDITGREWLCALSSIYSAIMVWNPVRHCSNGLFIILAFNNAPDKLDWMLNDLGSLLY